MMIQKSRASRGRHQAAFSLQEVAFSMGIAAVAIGGVVTGHTVSSQRAVWSTYSQAAQAQALMRLEQTRVAQWDPLANPPIDELVATNFPLLIQSLDLPRVGTNMAWSTNVTTITTISTDPPLRLIQVDSIWTDASRRVFSNSVITYRSPD